MAAVLALQCGSVGVGSRPRRRPRCLSVRWWAWCWRLLAVLGLTAPLGAYADPRAAPAPPPRVEIMALLGAVEQSGCSFGRNGRWHSATDARRMLEHKFEARHPGGDFVSAEQFIDLAATRSSMSGQPYLVRCAAGGPVVESRPWMHERLQAVRLARKAGDGGSSRP